MRNILRNRLALSTVVTTLIILVVSVLLAGVVTSFGINVTSVQMQQESLQIKRFHVWVLADSNPPEAAFLVINTGGRDVTFDKLAVRGQEVSYDKIYCALTDKPVIEDLTYVESLDEGGKILLIGVDDVTLNQATNNVVLPSGKSMIIYILNPGSVTINDIGLTVSVTVFTSLTLYYRETNVEAYVSSTIPAQRSQSQAPPSQTPIITKGYTGINLSPLTADSIGNWVNDYPYASTRMPGLNVYSETNAAFQHNGEYTVRIDPTNENSGLDYDPSVAFHPGDHVYMWRWIKAGGTTSVMAAGGRMGFDVYGVDGRICGVHSVEQASLGDGSDTGIDANYVHWGTDWTLCEWDFIVPSTYKSDGGGGNNVNQYPAGQDAIPTYIIPWIQDWCYTYPSNAYSVWVSGGGIYVNPT